MDSVLECPLEEDYVLENLVPAQGPLSSTS